MIQDLKPLMGKLALFAQDRMGFSHPPKLFLRKDRNNSQFALGKTAHYSPSEQSITIFVHARHPKDILRSFAHELVHHAQNLRGDLSPEKCGAMSDTYAQDNKHMRNMEKEAYLNGNMCFRDWENTLEDKDTIIIKIAESKFLKENKIMTKKTSINSLKELIRATIIKSLRETSNPVVDFLDDSLADDGTKKEKAPNSPVADAEAATEVPETPEETPPAKRGDKVVKEQEKQEKKTDNSTKKDDKSKKPKDGDTPRDDDTGRGAQCTKEYGPGWYWNEKTKKCDRVGSASEGKIINPEDWEKLRLTTPEKENELYQERFTPRNDRLFEELTKKYTK